MATKSKRQFRVWDVGALNESLEHVLQLLSTIDVLLEHNKPDEIPPSLVPTEMLYDIAQCYEAMYRKLLEESLIQTGNPKITETLH